MQVAVSTAQLQNTHVGDDAVLAKRQLMQVAANTAQLRNIHVGDDAVLVKGQLRPASASRVFPNESGCLLGLSTSSQCSSVFCSGPQSGGDTLTEVRSISESLVVSVWERGQ